MKKRKKFPPLKSTRCSIWVKAILKIHLSLKYSYKNTHTTINSVENYLMCACQHTYIFIIWRDLNRSIY